MLTSKASAHRRAPRRVMTALVALMTLGLTAPAVASAAPVTIIPGLPPIEIPEIPGLPTPPSQNTPAPEAPKPTPETTTPPTPAGPKIPDVETKTGYIALADDTTHQITWWHNGKVVKQMPISMGSDRFPTPNGTYFTKEKYRDMYMDSSTYGVPIDHPDGYRTYVEYAVRMSWSGIFIHAAPWSLAQQGVSNVSHGCINVSTENGKWIFDNVPSGTPIVVANTVGPAYDGN